MAEPTVRESIASSIASLEASAAPSTPTPAPGSEPTPAPGAPTPAPTPAPGAPAAAPAAAPGARPAPAPAAASGARPAAAAPGTPPAAAAPGPAPTPIKAPQSWKPEMRERWNSLPPEVQQEVLRREREISTGLQGAAEARRFHEQFNQALTPYKAFIDMEGGDPLKAFGDYLKTAAILRSGSPQDKAMAFAQATRQYGIDVNLLDQALTAVLQGRPNQPGQPAYRDPRLDDVIQRLDRQEQASQAAVNAQASQELQAFRDDPVNEFFADVAQDVADMLEVAANAGRVLSLKDAYDKACMLHPDVSKVIEQRRVAALTEQQQQRVGQARHAASSIPPTITAPAGVVNDKPLTVRDAIKDSIAKLQGQA